MGGRTTRMPTTFPPIPGDSIIWSDVWKSADQGETWTPLLDTDRDHWPARAYFRAECLKRYRENISHANWDVLTFDVGEQREQKVPLLDPLKGTKKHVQALLDSSPDAKILLDNLSQG